MNGYEVSAATNAVNESKKQLVAELGEFLKQRGWRIPAQTADYSEPRCIKILIVSDEL